MRPKAGRGRGCRGIVLAGTIALVFGLPAAASAAAVVVTDDAGRTVRLPAVPERVVSLAPGETEIVYALGRGERLVAVNEWSDFPPEALAVPRVRGIRPSLEQMVALRPDLILFVGGMGDVVSQFEAQGLPVLVLAPRNLEGVYRGIERLGAVLGAPERARAIARGMRDRVAGVRARLAGARRPRVFYEVDGTDPVRPFTAGPGTFIHELLELAGGENVAAGAQGAWPQISLERLLKADPEIIILGDAIGVNNPQTAEMVMRRPGWEQVTAVRRRAIHAVDGNLAGRPGPRLVEGLEALARIIHPERFALGWHPERFAHRHLLASFLHVSFEAAPRMAPRLGGACAAWRH
ncbi:MAG TPA: ABC transporter substrate-binding protein [Candidatus Methylomirabilis sp.]